MLDNIDWPGARQGDADQLDRPQLWRRVTFRPSRAAALEIFTAARHAVGRHLHGAGAGAPAGRQRHVRRSVQRWRRTRNRPAAWTDRPRGAANKEKTGVFTGGYAINPVNDRQIPVWIADYVMMGYGTGAIMAVPRDSATSPSPRSTAWRSAGSSPARTAQPALEEAYDSKDTGEMINSGPFDGTPVKGAVGKGHGLAGGQRNGAAVRSTTACATG